MFSVVNEGCLEEDERLEKEMLPIPKRKRDIKQFEKANLRLQKRIGVYINVLGIQSG